MVRNMQVANVLSDLNSLLVCENQDAAQSLVAARPIPSTTKGLVLIDRNNTESTETSPQDPDLARAYQLLKLHREVKQAYSNNDTREDSALNALKEARSQVREAIEGFGKDGITSWSLSSNQEEMKESTPQEQEQDKDQGQDQNLADMDDDEIAAWS